MEHRRPGRRKQAVQPTDDGAAGEGSGRPDCNEMMTTGGGHRGGQVPAARVSACIATQRGSHPLCDHRGRCREGSHWFRPVSLHVDRMYCPPLLIGHDQATGLRPLTTYKLCQASLTNLASHGVSIRPDVARSGCRFARTDVDKKARARCVTSHPLMRSSGEAPGRLPSRSSGRTSTNAAFLVTRVGCSPLPHAAQDCFEPPHRSSVPDRRRGAGRS